jgi:hypothetical protein
MLPDSLALTQATWIQIFKKCNAADFGGFLALAQVCPTLSISGGAQRRPLHAVVRRHLGQGASHLHINLQEP